MKKCRRRLLIAVVERDTTGLNWMDLPELDGSNGQVARQEPTSATYGQLPGLFLSPCQGEGRGFESRRPLQMT